YGSSGPAASSTIDRPDSRRHIRYCLLQSIFTDYKRRSSSTRNATLTRHPQFSEPSAIREARLRALAISYHQTVPTASDDFEQGSSMGASLERREMGRGITTTLRSCGIHQ